MRKISLILFVVFFSSILCGCSSKLMQPADSTLSESQPAPDESKIVFLRATSLGGAVQAFVCEEKAGNLEYIAIISSGAKVAHVTTPGKHIYFTGAEHGELLETDMEGGKTYYASISPRMGWWKAGFAFVPVTSNELLSKRFKDDLAWCDWREPNQEGQAWFRENLPSLKTKYIDALEEFTRYPEKRKVLKPEDGTKTPPYIGIR